ncbi:MAG: FAD-dependent oxidoreductase [Cellvibrionaceae bacterium]|nr:FAD-dependent oxidoreductase [Cellvibrionaceae bacterium]
MFTQPINLILGGGIAGLWLLNRLNQQGMHTLLIDTAAIGSGQTLSSQGIIHGGIKYTLNGALSQSANAIADMPRRWLNCLQGCGEIDLRKTQLLSDHQLMWSAQSMSGKLGAFFSSKAVRGKMQLLHPQDCPDALQNSAFKGQVYQLNEPVLDVPSLIDDLINPWKNRILHTQAYRLLQANDGRISHILLEDTIKIPVKTLILAAGEGNEALLKQLGINSPKMQRRPLQMVLLKAKNLPRLYAHCIGASTKPLLTITTHKHRDGENVWYLGGNIAEDGGHQDSAVLLEKAQHKIKKLLPWINLEQASWATHKVNRAEPLQSGLLRPDTAFMETHHNTITTWPTKLALAPVLADKLIEHLGANTKNEAPDTTALSQLAATCKAEPAQPLWDRLF